MQYSVQLFSLSTGDNTLLQVFKSDCWFPYWSLHWSSATPVSSSIGLSYKRKTKHKPKKTHFSTLFLPVLHSPLQKHWVPFFNEIDFFLAILLILFMNVLPFFLYLFSLSFVGSSGILVHCISGWDRTPLYISLLRLSLWADGAIHQSLKPEEILYLTIAYDWYLFGWVMVSFFCYNSALKSV